MKRKTMLLAAAALSALAFTALPSMASAFEETPSVSPVAPAEFPLAYTGAGGAGVLYTASGRNVNCEGNSASGSFTDSMTGSAKVTFTGCRENTLNSKCTTAGQSSGTIVTETLPTHTVYLSGGSAGVLFTPAENGKFAAFSCVGGFVKIEVKGSGVLGTVTSPEVGGEASSSFTINVSATSEGQEHTETAEGETYGLESNTNGGAFEPAFEQAGSTTATLGGGAEAKTTE